VAAFGAPEISRRAGEGARAKYSMARTKSARVIARPSPARREISGRTERRHDYAVEPPRPMLMDVLVERRVPIFGIARFTISITAGASSATSRPRTTPTAWRSCFATLTEQKTGLVFAKPRGFRHALRTPEGCGGFAKSLEEFDYTFSRRCCEP